ncbi:MAG: hypothetical protein RLZZ494_2404 [Pseudomonadota bacterium]|jgi:peptidoglycan-associated lipoprotein
MKKLQVWRAGWAIVAVTAGLAGCATRVPLDVEAPLEVRTVQGELLPSDLQAAPSDPLGSAIASLAPVTRPPRTHPDHAATDAVAANEQAAAAVSGNKVYFDFDSFDIRDEFRPLIGRYAGQMLASAKRVLVVEGYADERGSREYNLALGQKRAGAVLQALQAQGVPRQRMEAISWGEERPADPGHNEVAWARNRRAELKMRSR